MQMDAGLDTGPMIDVVDVPIAPRETAGTLTAKLAAAGRRRRSWPSLAAPRTRRRACVQRRSPATASPMRAKIGARRRARSTGRTPADAHRPRGPRVRSGARRVHVVAWSSRSRSGPRSRASRPATEPVRPAAGTVRRGRCGRRRRRLRRRARCGLRTVQPAGGKRMAAAAFAAGRALAPERGSAHRRACAPSDRQERCAACSTNSGWPRWP